MKQGSFFEKRIPSLSGQNPKETEASPLERLGNALTESQPEISEFERHEEAALHSEVLPSSPEKIAEEGRSAAILKAAAEVFAETGFAAARMDDVATRAGVAKGLIYFYYKNKEQLFETVLKNYITAPLRQLLGWNPAESMARRLVRILNNIYETTTTTPLFFQVVRLVLLEGPRFPRLHQYYFDEALLPIMGAIRECLAEGARRGEWRMEDTPCFIQQIVAPSIIMTLWRMAMHQYQEIEVIQYMEEHQRCLLRSLRLDDEAIKEAMTVSGLPQTPSNDSDEVQVAMRVALNQESSPVGVKRSKSRLLPRKRRTRLQG